jgi:glycosyltransferase involved in cell wall biosynthesis
MKVLVVDNSPAMGGSVHQLASQVKSLAPLGVRFHIIASDPALYRGLVPDSVPVQGLAAPAFRNVFTMTGAMHRDVLPGVLNKPFSFLAYRKFRDSVAPEFLSIVKDFEPDLLHLNNMNLANKVFADAVRIFGTPVIVFALMIRLFSRAERALAARADLVACVSHAVAGYLSKVIPELRPEKVGVIESSFDLERYRVERDPSVRAELGIPADAPVVLSLGRLTPWKGHDILIRALAQASSPFDFAQGKPKPQAFPWLLQAGGEEGEYRKEIDRLVDEVGLRGRVVFAGVRPDVPRLLAASDLLVHSSKFSRPEDGVVEAFGRVIVEGMAAGLPVVATRAGGATEILKDTEAGRLVEPGDVKGMADAIGYYLDNPTVARSAGEVGLKVAERYNEGDLAKKLSDLYQKAISLKGKKPE